MNHRVFSLQRTTTSLATATSWQYAQSFTRCGLVTHLAFDISGQSHIAAAAGHMSLINIDVTINSVKIVDGMTVQHALAFADHFGGAVEFTENENADTTFAARFALPIGCKFIGPDDKLEVTISCGTSMAGAGATVTCEVGIVNHFGIADLGVFLYSRRDLVLAASQQDEKTISKDGLVSVFYWDSANHVDNIMIPDTGVGLPSSGSAEIFKAASLCDDRQSSYGEATFWNKMIRVWSGKGKGVMDVITASLKADATGQTCPIYGVQFIPSAGGQRSAIAFSRQPANSKVYGQMRALEAMIR